MEHSTEQVGEGRRGNPNWQQGVSGNPAGRPKGSRNKATLMLEAMMAEDGEAMGRAAVALAKTGNLTALRLCLSRICPPARERTVNFELPPIESAADAARASVALLRAVAEGDLSPGEASELGRLVEVAARAFTAVEAG